MVNLQRQLLAATASPQRGSVLRSTMPVTSTVQAVEQMVLSSLNCLQFELADDHNFGLEGTISFFQGVQTRFPDVSMADIIAFGAIVSIETCNGPAIPFKAGRIDATSRNAPLGERGNPDASIDVLLSEFERLGFTSREFVAITSGSHSVG
ncbi:hypothetical protein HK102_007976 [Quaeritorhiza haematococci]|nr:hypothetical protein HK102_007976 [Quaeritorhiza haematococci]